MCVTDHVVAGCLAMYCVAHAGGPAFHPTLTACNDLILCNYQHLPVTYVGEIKHNRVRILSILL